MAIFQSNDQVSALKIKTHWPTLQVTYQLGLQKIHALGQQVVNWPPLGYQGSAAKALANVEKAL